MAFHLIADDLGLDADARREPAEQTGPTWIDVEDVLLERGVADLLSAALLIDEIEGAA